MLIFLLCFLHDYAAAQEVEFSYNPGSSLGPQFWPSLFRERCGGTRQSPVNLQFSTSKYVNYPLLNFVNYNLVPTTATLVNDGHTAMVSFDSSTTAPTISGGGLNFEYQFLQYHFHWGSNNDQGSEHTVDGVRYPLELHIVHVKRSLVDNVELALEEPDGIAVIAVFFEIGKFDNPVLEPIINAMSAIVNSGTETTFDPVYALKNLLPINPLVYYRYEGSLTTPRCFEAAVWTVFAGKLTISDRQLTQFRRLLDSHSETVSDNFRPVQPLNGRSVYRTGPIKFVDLCAIPFVCPLMSQFLKTLLIAIRAFLTFG